MNKEDEFPYGHYNYCDYRCETCEFIAKCPVFQEELKAEQEGKDWVEVLQDNFKKTRDMLQTFMDENDIEISPGDEDLEFEDKYQKINEEVEKKPAHRLAYDYMTMAMDFLKTYPAASLVLSGLEEARADLESYSTLIPVKLHRTLMSLYEFVDDEDDFHLLDAYLTSRVVYKALHKSLVAVEQIRKVWTWADVQEDLDELESLLLEIRIEFKREFPFEILISLINWFKDSDK
jgi:hypothetical protein